MLEDFQSILQALDFNQIWKDTLGLDPNVPAIRNRRGWRGIEGGIDGSAESWKQILFETARKVASKFSEQISWRFQNLKRFNWIKPIHPSEFEARKNASAQEQRELIKELRALYPTAVPDPLALEHCLNVLYNNQEISALLKRILRERDSEIIKNKERRRKQARANEETAEARQSERESVEDNDFFEVRNEVEVNVNAIIEGKPSIQDLLIVIRRAELEEALPQAMAVLELAAVIPLTSVHCDRVFSRMKKVVSWVRSTMLQKRKEMLVFLQVEHKTLRWLLEQQNFKDHIVTRFKSYNRRRFERFSTKQMNFYLL